MVTVKILEEHGLSLHTSSPQTAAKQLESALNSLSGELGANPTGIVTRSIGRSTYHLAIFPVDLDQTEPVRAEAVEVDIEEKPKPRRSKKSDSE